MEFSLTADLLQAVSSLPRRQRTKVMEVIGAAEFQRCADDPMYWLDTSRHVPTKAWPKGLPYVFTSDPHRIYTCWECDLEVNEEKRADHLEIMHREDHPTLHRMRQAYAPLPFTRPFMMLPYIAPIVDAWMTNQYFIIEKSRDMMATWLMIALHTWDAMFHAGRQHILQSEDAFKTLELVKRANVIYENTPEFLKKAIGPCAYKIGNTKSGELYLEKQKSEILGLPQGPNQIRQFHPSGVFSDECAFQDQAADTFAAIKPAIMSGGKYSAISTANRSWFELVARDLTDD